MEELAKLRTARSLVALKKNEEAIAIFTQILSSSPNYADAYVGLGVALLQMKKTKAAVSAFKRALNIQANNTEALFNLAGALSILGYYNSAQSHFEKVLKLEPQNAEACYQLALLMVKNNQDELAEPWLHKAIQFDSKHFRAVASLGIRAQQRNRLDDAISLFERALAINPRFAQAIVYLGSALEDLGNKKEAIASYQHALDLDPSNALALARWLALDNVSFPSTLLEKIVKLAEDVSVAREDQVRLRFALGKHFDRNEQYAEAAYYIVKANKLQNSLRADYSPVEQEKFVDRMISVFNSPAKPTTNLSKQLASQNTDVQPIFIVGTMEPDKVAQALWQ